MSETAAAACSKSQAFERWLLCGPVYYIVLPSLSAIIAFLFFPYGIIITPLLVILVSMAFTIMISPRLPQDISFESDEAFKEDSKVRWACIKCRLIGSFVLIIVSVKLFWKMKSMVTVFPSAITVFPEDSVLVLARLNKRIADEAIVDDYILITYLLTLPPLCVILSSVKCNIGILNSIRWRVENWPEAIHTMKMKIENWSEFDKSKYPMFSKRMTKGSIIRGTVIVAVILLGHGFFIHTAMSRDTTDIRRPLNLFCIESDVGAALYFSAVLLGHLFFFFSLILSVAFMGSRRRRKMKAA